MNQCKSFSLQFEITFLLVLGFLNLYRICDLQITALLYKFLAFSLVYVDALVTDCFTVVGEKAGTKCLSVNEHI